MTEKFVHIYIYMYVYISIKTNILSIRFVSCQSLILSLTCCKCYVKAIKYFITIVGFFLCLINYVFVAPFMSVLPLLCHLPAAVC